MYEMVKVHELIYNNYKRQAFFLEKKNILKESKCLLKQVAYF